MDKFFSLFGKLVFFVVVIGVLVGVGIYIGKKYTPQSPSQQAAMTVTPTGMVHTPTNVPPTGVPTVVAGGIKPFVAYTLMPLADWTVNKTHDASVNTDKLELTKGDYQIVITQAAMGGGGCSFPGVTPAEMSIPLTDPHDISSLFKRGKAPSSVATQESYTVCQKASDGSYSTITSFGAITYTTPLSPAQDVLSQMDSMIGSLQKQ